jgi:hypothetical protein
MESFEEIALDTAEQKPVKLLRYVCNTSVVWPRGPIRLQQLLHHLNSIKPAIKFIMEVEAKGTLGHLGHEERS